MRQINQRNCARQRMRGLTLGVYAHQGAVSPSGGVGTTMG